MSQSMQGKFAIYTRGAILGCIKLRLKYALAVKYLFWSDLCGQATVLIVRPGDRVTSDRGTAM